MGGFSLRGLIFAVATVAMTAAVSPGAARNSREPQIGYVYPAGGRQGTEFEVRLAGRFLDGINDVLVSGTGVKASLVEHVKPLNGKQINLLRDEMKQLQAKLKAANKKGQKKGAGGGQREDIDRAAIQKRIAEIRKKLANPKNRNRDNIQLSEDVRLKVVVSEDAAPGRRDLRLNTAKGLTNPVVFNVSQLAEYSENAPGEDDKKKQDADQMQVFSDPPLVINGQIMPGDVDRFGVKLRGGTKLVVAVSARELIPYIADAVPGWFQATLALYDSEGNELAYVDDYRFDPDPVLFYEIDRDGEYVIEIKDAIYRGREDFVYRIAVGEFPFVTSIFPLGGRVGEAASVQVKGWNLPSNSIEVDNAGQVEGVRRINVKRGRLVSNPIAFAVDSLPEVAENESNDRRATAQPVKSGTIVNGRINKAGDSDFFAFEGRAGDEIVAEVYARRLNSPLDSVLKLADSKWRELAVNDDHEDRAFGLVTHHADSKISAVLASAGTHYVQLCDAQGKGGEAYAYRLRVSGPRPDFELRVAPSTVNARTGGAARLKVYALRRDGFKGEIGLSLKNAPEGFALAGGKIAAGKDEAQVSLRVPRRPLKKPVSLEIEGRAKIGGVERVRAAAPADDMMQAFIYRHLVCADELKVSVTGPAKGNQGGRRPVAAARGAAARRKAAAQKKADQDRKTAAKKTDAVKTDKAD